jgi:hypothetical protein
MGTLTFKSLQNTVSRMEVRRGNLADRLDAVLDSARVNADDTCHVEKAQPVATYDAVALASLESILSYEKDSEVCDWFEAQGVTW